MYQSYDVKGEVLSVATKSFLKNVSLRDTKQCQNFIRALEKSDQQRKDETVLNKPVHEMTREQIRKIFGAENA